MGAPSSIYDGFEQFKNHLANNLKNLAITYFIWLARNQVRMAESARLKGALSRYLAT